MNKSEITLPEILQILANKADTNEKTVRIITNDFIYPLDQYLSYLLSRQKLNFNVIIYNVFDLHDIQLDPNDIIIVIYNPFIEQFETLDSILSVTESTLNLIKEKSILELNRLKIFTQKLSNKMLYLHNPIETLNIFSQKRPVEIAFNHIQYWTECEMAEFIFVNKNMHLSDKTFNEENNSIKSIFGNSQQTLKIIAERISECMIQNLTPQKKILFLDCDNTLWKGVVSEDNWSDICDYYEIQEIVNFLSESGVVICLVTKNEAEEFENFFKRDHRIKHTNVHRILSNWDLKSENIRKILESYEFAPESAVFIDDNAMEILEVKQRIPEIMCQLVSGNYLEYVNNFIKMIEVFGLSEITLEDRLRTSNYKTENLRQSLKLSSKNDDDYLRNLRMKYEFKKYPYNSQARILQLMDRTNQFNLTQLKMSDREITEAQKSGNFEFITLYLEDKYSALGEIALIVLEKSIDQLIIKNINISCRAFGRGVEKLVLSHIFKFAKENEYEEIIGEFRNSNKNSRFSGIYEDLGFKLIESDTDTLRYHINIAKHSRYQIESNNFAEKVKK